MTLRLVSVVAVTLFPVTLNNSTLILHHSKSATTAEMMSFASQIVLCCELQLAEVFVPVSHCGRCGIFLGKAWGFCLWEVK